MRRLTEFSEKIERINKITIPKEIKDYDRFMKGIVSINDIFEGIMNRINAITKVIDYYITFDILHKGSKVEALTVTQLSNDGLKLIAKIPLKRKNNDSIEPVLSEVFQDLENKGINLNNTLIHSDREPTWNNYNDNGIFNNFLLTEGCRNSPLKECCQNNEVEEISIDILNDNTKNRVIDMLQKQIDKMYLLLQKKLSSPRLNHYLKGE